MDFLAPDSWYYRSVVINWNRVFPAAATVVLFVLSIGLLILAGRKKRNDRFLVLYTIAFLILYFFPVSAYILRFATRYGHVYWRMLWMIPWSLIIAAAFTETASRLRNRFLKTGLIAVLILTIGLTGNQAYLGEDRAYTKAPNVEKVPPEAMEILEMIYESENVTEKASVKLAVPPQLTPYIRQIDGTITMPFGRIQIDPDPEAKPENRLYYCLRTDEAFVPEIMTLLKETDCDYVVVSSPSGYDPYLEESCIKLGSAGNYDLWKLT